MVEDKADDEEEYVNIGNPGLPPSVTDADIARTAGWPATAKSKEQHYRELAEQEHERRMERGKECVCPLGEDE